jgi:hypothetical protein
MVPNARRSKSGLWGTTLNSFGPRNLITIATDDD